MYNQLTNSIRGDAPSIQQNFEGAIEGSQERGQQAQSQIQEAARAAAANNAENLKALGLGEAAENIISRGADVNTKAAGDVADVAARTQIATDQLGQHQAASVAHNTNLAGASGLEGNLQRARIGSELSNLLAQYDVQEQEANRQAQQSFLSQILGLGQALSGDAWQRQGYMDDMQKWLYEQEQAAAAARNRPGLGDANSFLNQILTQNPDLKGPEDSQQYVAMLNSLLKSLRG